jgi:hypothetical protein
VALANRTAFPSGVRSALPGNVRLARSVDRHGWSLCGDDFCPYPFPFRYVHDKSIYATGNPAIEPLRALLGGVDPASVVMERLRGRRVRIGADEGDRNGSLRRHSFLVDRGFLYRRFRRKCSGTCPSIERGRAMPPCPATSF